MKIWVSEEQRLIQFIFIIPVAPGMEHCSLDICGISEWPWGEGKLTCVEFLLCVRQAGRHVLEAPRTGIIFVLQLRKHQRTLLTPKLRKEIRC